MEEKCFRLKCGPDFRLCERRFDYLVFEWIDQAPEQGYFVASAPEWGDVWKLCRVVSAENCSLKEPFLYCEDGSSYPQDARPFGRLKYGRIEFDQRKDVTP